MSEMEKTKEQVIKEGKLIGLKVKNKKKTHCINGHELPPARRVLVGNVYRTRRDCKICINDRRKKNKVSYKQNKRYQAIRDSKFPLITYLGGLKK